MAATERDLSIETRTMLDITAMAAWLGVDESEMQRRLFGAETLPSNDKLDDWMELLTADTPASMGVSDQADHWSAAHHFVRTERVSVGLGD